MPAATWWRQSARTARASCGSRRHRKGLGRDRLADRPAFQSALAAVSGGRFVAVPGGVLIGDGEARIIGAVGISGDTSDRDEYCAIAGIRAAGLASDPAEPPGEWAQSRL